MHTNTTRQTPNGFDSLNLISPLCRAVNEKEYSNPTPIQMQAVPHLLKGRDLLGCAQTGTGKTAAFGIFLVENLAISRRYSEGLILVPTRELAIQVNSEIRRLAKYSKIQS